MVYSPGKELEHCQLMGDDHRYDGHGKEGGSHKASSCLQVSL